MIEAKFCLFEVEIEGASGHAAEPGQTTLSQAPEAFYAVDVVELLSEDVLPVLDPEVLVEAQID